MDVVSADVELSWTLRQHCAMRSRTITHQMNRKRVVRTSRTNGHPKFSQTISSKKRSSGKLSETPAGTGAHNVGSNGRPHAIQNDHRLCTDDMDCPTRSLAHSSCQEQRCTITPLSCDGWSVSWKSAGVWWICTCSSSRGGTRIQESRTKAG